MNIKYFIYARKSSEDDNKQVQSIEDQIKVLTDYALKEQIAVVKIYSESKSAKAPGKRKQFSEMLQALKHGKAQGILCWQLNRLSRNPVDSAEIQWLLQQGMVKSVRTPEKEFRPEDNTLIWSVETGVANQFILDLKKNTKRGVNSKIDKGWYPSFAPMGYKNTVTENQGENFIIKDEDRYDLVRKMWDLMLTGAYTVEDIRNIANEEWDFKTRKCRKKGNKPIARSSMYTLFTNIFYTGQFEYAGEIFQGKHEAMISFAEYDRVQDLLGRKGRPRQQKHIHAYIGWARCGECGCAITASKKRKTLSTGEVKFYTYYHCTHRKERLPCNQRGYVTEPDLENQINTILKKITILPIFKEWALTILRRNHEQQVQQNKKVYEGHFKAKNETTKQLNNLLDYLTRGVITEDEYYSKKDEYKTKIVELDRLIQTSEKRAYDWLETAEDVFTFISHAREKFNTGSISTRREILHALGTFPRIKDGKVEIEFHKWLQPVLESYQEVENQYYALELDKVPNNQAFLALENTWGG